MWILRLFFQIPVDFGVKVGDATPLLITRTWPDINHFDPPLQLLLGFNKFQRQFSRILESCLVQTTFASLPIHKKLINGLAFVFTAISVSPVTLRFQVRNLWGELLARPGNWFVSDLVVMEQPPPRVPLGQTNCSWCWKFHPPWYPGPCWICQVTTSCGGKFASNLCRAVLLHTECALPHLIALLGWPHPTCAVADRKKIRRYCLLTNHPRSVNKSFGLSRHIMRDYGRAGLCMDTPCVVSLDSTLNPPPEEKPPICAPSPLTSVPNRRPPPFAQWTSEGEEHSRSLGLLACSSPFEQRSERKPADLLLMWLCPVFPPKNCPLKERLFFGKRNLGVRKIPIYCIFSIKVEHFLCISKTSWNE